MIHKLSEALRQRVEVNIRDDEGNVLSGAEPGDDEIKRPGGGIEAGETPREAAEREVAEETGVKITNIESSRKPDVVTNKSRTQFFEARATHETHDPRKGADDDVLGMVGFRPEAEVEKTSMTRAERKEKDLELWREYNKNPSKQNLKPLMKALDPVIQVEVNKWSGAIARPVLESKAKSLALEAIKSYDPYAGAALATHVTNRLKKLSRKVYTHQDAVRLPEYKKLKVQNLHKANQQLMDVHGREPTNQELADHLAWAPKTLSKVQQAQHAELIESGDMGAGMFENQSVWGSDSGDGMVDMLYYDMNPEDKLIFEHSTGYSGKPILSNKELRKKTNLTQGQLSYRKRQLVDMFQDQMV